MKITEQDVQHVAHLARLNLTQEDLTTMTKQLDTFLTYVDKISALDTKDVVPTTHFFSKTNAFRNDDIRPSLSQKDALNNCAQTDEESFLVPRIL